MSRSAAARNDAPELVKPPEVSAEPEEYGRVGEELREEDREVVRTWVESLRATAGEMEATRDAWEALATVFAALVVGVVLCYFLAHL